MNTKEKFASDLKRANQNGMADFILNNKDPNMEKLIDEALSNKQYLVFCKTCGKVYVDMPFKQYYKIHTHPEWDIWFCDAVLHWAETEGKHSIYCFSDAQNYDISGSLSFDCRNSSWPQIHRDMKDVVKMKKGFMKRRDKAKVWITSKGENHG